MTGPSTLKRFSCALLLPLLGMAVFACAGKTPPVVLSAQDGYTEAHALYEAGKWEKARLAFEQVVFNHPGSALVDSAQYFLGMCYFKMEDPILAAAEFQRVRTQYPASPLVDDADIMRCRSLLLSSPSHTGLDQEPTREAVNELRLFQDNHPFSEFLPAADSLLKVAYGRLSTKDFKTGVLYQKLGRYEAARVYLQEMIDRYPESPLVPDALYRLGEGQRRQDSLASAIEYYEKLIYTFPDHERTGDARKRVARLARQRAVEAADSSADTSGE
ncbi:MAG: outer membrane protein assembly factor BamD [Candidatus Zixiibacteriota bacterium]